MTDQARVAAFLGAAPGRKPAKDKCDADLVQAWRSHVKDLETFVKGLKKGSIPPEAPEPAPPAETSDCAGVKKLVNQAANERRKVPDARAIATELATAAAARAARAAYAAGALPTPAPGPSTYYAWEEPTIGPENADGAYSLDEMELQDRETAAALLSPAVRTNQPSARTQGKPSVKEGLPWGWIAGGVGVLVVGGLLVRRAMKGR
jgi:hypothetical protein